jgi:hypothetical protein
MRQPDCEETYPRQCREKSDRPNILHLLIFSLYSSDRFSDVVIFHGLISSGAYQALNNRYPVACQIFRLNFMQSKIDYFQFDKAFLRH